MPHYYFHLHDGAAGVRDTEGTDFPDQVAARTHAMQVARELMSKAEAQKRHWQLDVCDDGGTLLFHLPFIAADCTVDHLDVQTRQVVERLCQTRGELAETVFKTTLQARALCARANAKPYLVTHQFGRPVITAHLSGNRQMIDKHP